MTDVSASSGAPEAKGTAGRTPKMAAAASLIGSTLEYYDYMLYALAAALVFPHVFFPESDPAVATLLSLASYGVAYAARPVGAVILGTVGDRIGRKRLLQFTIILMGVATLGIGILPGYTTIGIAAPALLVLFRILQGFSTAAEGAAGSTMTLEHAPDNKRAFISSWTMSGVQGGQALASLAFIPVALLPEDALYSWGWRIPFLLSALVVIVAVFIRRAVSETPEFVDAKERGELARTSMWQSIKTNRVGIGRVILCSFYAVPSSLATVFGVAYATSEDVGVGSNIMLWGILLANVVAIGSQPLWALLSDRVGRKPVWIGGTLASVAGLWGFLAVIGTGSAAAIIAVTIVFLGFIYTASNATTPAFFTEMFPTHVRTFGMAVGMQFGLVLFGFAPTIAQSLGGDVTSVVLLAGVAAVIAALSALTARETAHVPTAELNGTAVSDAATTAR